MEDFDERGMGKKNIIGVKTGNDDEFCMSDFLQKMGIKADGGGKRAGDNIIGVEFLDSKKGFEKGKDFENGAFGENGVDKF